ncbi:MAG: LytR/AlgR family response regulator transcription factor [Wujia sp.]
MNIAICDDNLIFCEQLHTLLLNYFKKYHIKDTNIKIFNSGEEILNSPDSFDLAFLDVEMKELSGTYTGNELTKRNPNLIFFIITSYPQYLDEALHFHAFRYLSKPLDTNRLYLNLKDALYVFHTRQKKVVVETMDKVLTINSSSIIMLETINRKVVLHTCSGSITSTQPLKYWLSALEGLPFFQSHKSYIVNFAHVDSFNDNLIFMTDNLKAYLTQRKYGEFKKNYLMYIDTTM